MQLAEPPYHGGTALEAGTTSGRFVGFWLGLLFGSLVWIAGLYHLLTLVLLALGKRRPLFLAFGRGTRFTAVVSLKWFETKNTNTDTWLLW